MSYYISQVQQNFWHGKFSTFPNEFVYAVSTRLSGVSQSPFDSLNLALHVGDQAPDVLTNRKYFAASLNLDARNIVTPNQVHGDHIVRVDDTHRGRGALSYDDSIKETDALITNTPNLPLMLCFADCVPIFLIDPEHRAVGLAHAGWKGTVKRIAAKTLNAMSSEFGTQPADCLIGIGPSIGACCYDVGDNVIAECQSNFPSNVGELLIERDGKTFFDLQRANEIALIDAGVPVENIDTARECTCCKSSRYFSYRAARRKGHQETGRIAALVSIRDF